MRIKRLTTAVGMAALLATATATAGADASAAAPKRKPLGYVYGKCTTKTSCTYQGTTNPTQTKISLSSTTICSTGGQALGRLGSLTIKPNGKFSADKTLSVSNYETYRTSTVRVQVSGKLTKGKSVTGSLKLTTTATDCTAETGVAKPFTLKYQYPYYGG